MEQRIEQELDEQIKEAGEGFKERIFRKLNADQEEFINEFSKEQYAKRDKLVKNIKRVAVVAGVGVVGVILYKKFR